MLSYSIELLGEPTKQNVHVWLNPNPFEDTQTTLAVLFEDVSASFSGTDPTVLTEVHCSLVKLQDDEKYRAFASRICGPDVFAGVIQAKALGRVDVSIDDHDLTAWGRLMWGPLQQAICRRTGQIPRLTLAEQVFAAQSSSPPNNVISLF